MHGDISHTHRATLQIRSFGSQPRDEKGDDDTDDKKELKASSFLVKTLGVNGETVNGWR
jgi:hypothetical protein